MGTFRKLGLFTSSCEGRKTFTRLGSIEGASLSMDAVFRVSVKPSTRTYGTYSCPEDIWVLLRLSTQSSGVVRITFLRLFLSAGKQLQSIAVNGR
jgi:hypothetical protein